MTFDPTRDLVSIIMPAYKAEAYIDETLDSVVSQTHHDWELLVADDCSPDGTRDRIAVRSGQDGRIKLIGLEKNGGPAAARNAALAAAQGRWIAFLDSDDLWLPAKLEIQLAFHKDRDVVMTYTGFRRMKHDGTEVGRYVSPPKSLNYRQALQRTAIPTSTVLIDRCMSGDFRMKKVYYDDFACWLDILRDGGQSYGLDVDFMRYRVNAGSVSRNKIKSMKEVWRQLRQTENLSIPRAAQAFGGYAFHAALKYSRF